MGVSLVRLGHNRPTPFGLGVGKGDDWWAPGECGCEGRDGDARGKMVGKQDSARVSLRGGRRMGRQGDTDFNSWLASLGCRRSTRLESVGG